MSNRYEREIEEILRKTDDGRPSAGDRIRAMNQRPPTRLRQRGFNFTLKNETWFIIGIALAFVGATIAWYFQTQRDASLSLAGLVAGIVGVASLAVIVFVLVTSWMRLNRGPQASWRGQSVNDRGGPRRTPFSNFLIRLNLIKLRMNYRRLQR